MCLEIFRFFFKYTIFGALVLKCKSPLFLRDLLLSVVFKFDYLKNAVFRGAELSEVAASQRLRKTLPPPTRPAFRERVENAGGISKQKHVTVFVMVRSHVAISTQGKNSTPPIGGHEGSPGLQVGGQCSRQLRASPCGRCWGGLGSGAGRGDVCGRGDLPPGVPVPLSP